MTASPPFPYNVRTEIEIAAEIFKLTYMHIHVLRPTFQQ